RALVDSVRAAEGRVGRGDALTRAVAQNLAKLMTYKDEYEVARLFAKTAWEGQVKEELSGPYRVRFHLAPPILARRDRRGHPRKVAFGGWMRFAFALLAPMKRLRGGPLDPLGHTAERRAERALIGRYEAGVRRLVEGLRA